MVDQSDMGIVYRPGANDKCRRRRKLSFFFDLEDFGTFIGAAPGTNMMGLLIFAAMIAHNQVRQRQFIMITTA